MAPYYKILPCFNIPLFAELWFFLDQTFSEFPCDSPFKSYLWEFWKLRFIFQKEKKTFKFNIEVWLVVKFKMLLFVQLSFSFNQTFSKNLLRHSSQKFVKVSEKQVFVMN